MSSLWELTSIWELSFVLPLVTTIIFFYVGIRRRIKKLSYKILTNEPLLTVDEELKGKIKVLYENKHIENISLLIIKFLNTGNLEISPNEFEMPIELSFKKFSVLSVELTNAIPQTIDVKIKLESNKKIIIERLLLNKGDSFTIKVLLTNKGQNGHPSNAKKDLVLQTRIKGVTSINEITDYPSIYLFNHKISIRVILWVIAGILIGFAVITLIILILGIIYGKTIVINNPFF